MTDQSWAQSALYIVQQFDVFIIPLSAKALPVFKWVNFEDDTPPDHKPTKDTAIINQWATQYRAYGVIAGPNLLILDIDVKPNQNGILSLKFLIEQGFPTNGFTVKSASGGLHYYLNTPKHYTPKQGANLKVTFAEEETRANWDILQEGIPSTGVDIRHGNGYVVGPGSVVARGSYTIINEGALTDIPLNIQIGKSSSFKIVNKPKERDQTISFGNPIRLGNRDEEILKFTMGLARKGLPDDFAKTLIERRLEDCDNSDGEAPSFDTAWDKYTRAQGKVDDVIGNLINTKVYISTGQRVLDIGTSKETRLDDFKKELSNQRVFVDVMTSNGDTKNTKKNPCDIWMEDVDRKTVDDVIFDPRFKNGIVEVTEQDGYSSSTKYNRYHPIDFYKDTSHTQTGKDIFEACLRVIGNVLSDKADREWFLKWLGMSIFDPSFRPAWHWHIFGTVRGSGKTTLTKIVRALIGEPNCKDLDINAIDKDFNMEIFECCMGFLNDFTKVGVNSHDRVNTAFKRITGTDMYSKQAKYSEAEQAPIFIRFIMTSNSYLDFPVDTGDRRIYKCESKGSKLDHRTLVLAHGVVGVHGSTVGERDAVGVYINQNDVDSARRYMYEYLGECGYEDMWLTRDCPYNESKVEHRDVMRKSHIGKIEQAIGHKIFVFQSDIITKMSLQIYLDHIKVDTKVETVIQNLLDEEIISRVKYVDKYGRVSCKKTKLKFFQYDKDLDEVTESGISKSYLCYAVRDFIEWNDLKERRSLTKECRKIVGVKQISTTDIKKKTKNDLLK